MSFTSALFITLLLSIFYFISLSTAVDNGLGLTPPLGWSTWCTLGPCGRDYCDADEIKSVSDEMATNGLQKAGWNHLEMDDCWASTRTSNGEITADPNRFPQGLAPVASYLHSKGFTYGLYTDAGPYTCSQGGRPYKIPGSYGHYAQDAQTYAKWGMDAVKMDWCNNVLPNGTHLRPEVQYAEMSRALNQTGRPIYFLSCEWGVDSPWLWMRQFANGWRSTGDHHDNWKSTKSVIEAVANLGIYAGPGGWNFLDFLMTGGEGCPDNQPGKRCPGQTDLEYITEFSMWVMAASPLVVATEVRNMSEIQKTILLNSEMIQVHQDKLGRGGNRLGFWSKCSEMNACEVWGKLLFDGGYYVALYNSGEKQHEITVQMDELLGWVDLPVHVRDLWAHKDLGTFVNNYTATVPPHGVNAVRMWFTV